MSLTQRCGFCALEPSYRAELQWMPLKASNLLLLQPNDDSSYLR